MPAGLATLDALGRLGAFVRLGELAAVMETALRKALAEAGVSGRAVVLGPVWHLCPFVPGEGPFADHAASLPPDPARTRAGIVGLAAEATRRGVLAFPRPARG